MKLGESNYLIRQSFSPSFMKIGQKMWIFYKWSIFERVSFFSPHTLGLLSKLEGTRIATFFETLVLIYKEKEYRAHATAFY